MTRFGLAAILFLGAVALSACGNGDDETTTPVETPAPAGEAPAADAGRVEPAPVEPAAAAAEAPAPGVVGGAPAEAPPAGAAAAPPAEVVPAAPAAGLAVQNLENTLYLELFCGRVVIAMRADLAPLHVERIKLLAREQFYDGLLFHRVIAGFMAQTGDPNGDGTGGSRYPNLRAEFNNEPFVRGAVGMARTAAPDTANSQFFITYEASPWLNGQYTMWGNVTDGMECVDQIARGQPPLNPDRIITARVAADVQ